MPKITYNVAVALAVEEIRSKLSSDRQQLATPFRGGEGQEPLFIAQTTVIPSDVLAGRAASLVEGAKKDAALHASLHMTARVMREAGDTWPAVITGWLVDLQLGIIEPPKAERSVTEVVDGLIYDLIAVFSQLAGYPIDRNTEPSADASEEKGTACSVVADAFAHVRKEREYVQLPGSAETVRHRWYKLKKRYPYDPKHYAEFARIHGHAFWATVSEAIQGKNER